MPPIDAGLARGMRAAGITRRKVREVFLDEVTRGLALISAEPVQVKVRRHDAAENYAPRFIGFDDDDEWCAAAFAIGAATERVVEWLSRETMKAQEVSESLTVEEVETMIAAVDAMHSHREEAGLTPVEIRRLRGKKRGPKVHDWKLRWVPKR
jgi:hypothetical protein